MSQQIFQNNATNTVSRRIIGVIIINQNHTHPICLRLYQILLGLHDMHSLNWPMKEQNLQAYVP